MFKDVWIILGVVDVAWFVAVLCAYGVGDDSD